MSSTIRNLTVKFGADTTELNKSLKTMATELKTAGKQLESTGKKLTMGLTVPLVAAGVASVKLASDMEETISKVGVTFGENAKDIEAWAKTAIDKMGLAEQSAMDAAALYGDMGKGMGVATAAGLEMSMSLTQLSADLASFKNIAQDRAQTALTGVYTGETEALKSLGIVMTEANLKQFAMTKGITKSIAEMTQAEKVQLRYAYVMSVTADAQGDFVRTGGGAANQARMLQEQVKQLGTSFGQQLLPMATDALKSLNGLIKGFQNLSPETRKMIVLIGGVAAAAGPVMTVSGKLMKTVGDGISRVTKLGTSVTGLGTKITTFLGPAGTAVAVLSALVLVVGGVSIALTEANKEIISAAQSTNDLVTATKESAKAYEEQAKNTEAEYAVAQKLSDELFTLAKNENKTNAEKSKMKQLVGQLNQIVPELNLAYDEQNDILEGTAKATDDIIAAKRREAQATAQMERLTELYKEQYELTEKWAEAEKTLGERAFTAGAMLDDYLAGPLGSGATDNLTKAFQDVDAALTKNKENIENLESSLADGLVPAMETTAATIDSMEQSQEELALATEEAAKAQEEALKKLEQTTQAHYDSMGTIYDKAIPQHKESLDRINKNLENQVLAFASWRKNLKEISSKVPQDVYNELVKLGPEANTQIAAMLKPENKDKLDEFVTLMGQKAKLAKEAAFEDEGLGGLSGDTETELGNVQGVLDDNTAIYDSAKELGKSLTSGFDKGMTSGQGALFVRARAIASQVIKEMRKVIQPGSPSKVTTIFGRSLSEGLTLGMKQKMSEALGAAGSLSSRILGALSMPALASPRYSGFDAQNLPLSASLSDSGGSIAAAITKAIQGVQGGAGKEIIVPVYLDGREIARVTAPYMGQELQKDATGYGRGLGR